MELPLLVNLLCGVRLGWFLRLTVCVSPNAPLLIQYVLYTISLKTLDLPSGEGTLAWFALELAPKEDVLLASSFQAFASFLLTDLE